jgi:VanZ family protein
LPAYQRKRFPAIGNSPLFRILVSLGIVLSLSSVPPTSIPRVVSSYDKWFHVLLYAGIAWILSGGFSRTVLVILTGCVLGALDENYQRLTGRCPSLADWSADVLGVLAGALFWLLLRRLRTFTECKFPHHPQGEG